MKTIFFKRLVAFIIDYVLITLLLSIITIGFKTDGSLSKKVNEVMNNYAKNEISMEVYNEEVQKLNYELQKDSLPVNIISFVITVGYFFVFTYLNKGQTIGKKLLKLKVVEKEKKKPSVKVIIMRGIFIYGIVATFYNIIFINFLSVKAFSCGYTIVSYLQTIFIIVSFFMILYRKDKKGLHDIMSGTEVIGEVK